MPQRPLRLTFGPSRSGFNFHGQPAGGGFRGRISEAWPHFSAPGGFHAWRPARTMRDAQKEHQGTPEKKHQRGNTKKEHWKMEPTQKRNTKNIIQENTKGTIRKKSSCLPLQIEGHREGICSQGGSH